MLQGKRCRVQLVNLVLPLPRSNINIAALDDADDMLISMSMPMSTLLCCRHTFHPQRHNESSPKADFH
jgi:hypothetical protein